MIGYFISFHSKELVFYPTVYGFQCCYILKSKQSSHNDIQNHKKFPGELEGKTSNALSLPIYHQGAGWFTSRDLHVHPINV